MTNNPASPIACGRCGACVFLQANQCRIQSVKPRQCRDYPQTWHIPGEAQFCRARRKTI